MIQRANLWDISGPFVEFTERGWPVCPGCGEDELWSPLLWDGEGEQPKPQQYVDAGMRCYRCNWHLEPFGIGLFPPRHVT